jgi:acyl-CoA thioester hydrolase
MTVEPMHSEPVRQEWIDYNGHLSEPYYVLVFGHATDGLMDQVGLDLRYRTTSGCSLYTVEAHVRYLREVAHPSTLDVVTRVVDVDAKRAHLCHEMRVGADLAATEELLAVHVDTVAGRGRPFPEVVRDALAGRLEARPGYAGRAISLGGGGTVDATRTQGVDKRSCLSD